MRRLRLNFYLALGLFIGLTPGFAAQSESGYEVTVFDSRDTHHRHHGTLIVDLSAALVKLQR
jgi:hypothetical protein